MSIQSAVSPPAQLGGADGAVFQPNAAPARPSWLPRILGAAACLLVVGLFARTVYELSKLWREDDNYSHGFLVPLVSGFLAWRVLRQGLPARAGSAQAGMVWITGGCILHMLAILAVFPPIDFVALAAILHGIAVLAGGREWARQFRFPILFLFFMFPLPVVLTERSAVWLQGLVTGLATPILDFFVPTYHVGYMIHMPGCPPMEVGEACSGIRQIIAFAALTLLIAHLSERSLPFRAGLILAAPVIAVIANLLRVLVMAFVVYRFGPEWIGGAYHTAWGLLTMAAGLGLLLAIGWWLARLLPEPIQSAAGSRQTAVDSGQPSAPSSLPTANCQLTTGLGVAVVCLAITLAGQAALEAHLAGGVPSRLPELEEPLKSFPVSLGAWSGRDISPATLPSSASNYFESAEDKLNRSYVLPSKDEKTPRLSCQLWMIYSHDGQDRLHHPRVCHKAERFNEVSAGHGTVPLDSGRTPVERFCFERGGVRRYAYYWHYTLEPPPDAETTYLQRLRHRQLNQWPSLTITVFAPDGPPEMLEQVAGFVRLVDEALHGQKGKAPTHLPPGARMGTETLSIRVLASPRAGGGAN
jgi:exosortase